MTIFVSSTATSPLPTIADYRGLQEAVISWTHRSGDTEFANAVPNFIVLAEATMQMKFSLLEFEELLRIPVTAGVGDVPSDYTGGRSAYWDGDSKRQVQYITPERFDERLNLTPNTPDFFTVTGSTLKVSPTATGTLVLTYFGKFLPLSDANTSNSILQNSPGCYLYGALEHAYNWGQDDAQMQKYGILFNAECDRVIGVDGARRYSGPLQTRVK